MVFRDLFGEECFENDKFADIALKKLKRNINPDADVLLDWIEHGITDALTRKYVILPMRHCLKLSN